MGASADGWRDAATGMADEKSPDRHSLIEQAAQAVQSQDLTNALRLWERVVAEWPEDPAGPVGLAATYCRAKNYDAADAAIEPAVQRFADNAQVDAQHAWVAYERTDWPEAADRWRRYRERYPRDPVGPSALSGALRNLHRFDEADAVLLAGLADHPDHAELLGNYALVAQERKDWDEALRRWTAYRDRFPEHAAGYAVLGAVLRELQRFDDADAILRRGLELHPENAEMIGNFAWVAYNRHDWPEALKRWEAFRAKFPELAIGHTQVSLVLGELGRFDEAASLAQTEPDAASSELNARGLMLQFESLGDNCEFGVVQRKFGAEPLGLLRFTSTTPALLAKALWERMAGVGDPENTELVVERGEYLTRDARYHMSMHTFIPATDDDRQKRHQSVCRRIKFLREKLFEDLKSGEKHFVYVCHDRLPDDEVRALWHALRNYGDNRLLFAQLSDAEHPDNTLRQLEDDLIVAYFDHLSVDDPPYERWLAVCHKVHDLWTSPPAASQSDLLDFHKHIPEPAMSELTKYAVEWRAGCWGIRDGAAFLPIRNGGQPVSEFVSGWRPRFVYAGFQPIFLLELQHADGMHATWFMDKTLNRIGGSVAELNDEVKAQLRAAGLSLYQKLWDNVFAGAEPALPAELTGLSEINPGTAAALSGLIGLSPDEITWRDAGEIEQPAGSKLRQIGWALGTNLQQNYLKALDTGELTWPAPSDGRPLACHSLYIDHMITLYRCVDSESGLVFYICCAGHDIENVGVLIPEEKTGYYSTPHQKHLAEWLCHNLSARILRHLLANGHLLPDYFARGCTKFATSLWPGESFHIGHHLWNELSGLAAMVDHGSADHCPDVIVMGKSGDGEAYGRTEALFPELSAHVRRGIETDPELTALVCRENIQLMRFTGSHVTADLRRRILGLIAGDARQDGERAEIRRLRDAGFAIVVIGLRVENRTVAGLDEFCARVIEHLQERFGRVAIVLDGHNARDSGSTFPSFGEARSASPVAHAEGHVAQFIKAGLASCDDVAVIDNIGRSMSHSLLWAQHADFCVSAWGAGLAKYRWVANLPGVIWSSRWVLTQKGDLHIYDSDQFMEAPSRVRFPDPKHVFDIGEEPVLIQIFEPHHPMYFNFKINMKGLYWEIDRLIEDLDLPTVTGVRGAT
jgi:tetratricopeptide (TPR) repeat protein